MDGLRKHLCAESTGYMRETANNGADEIARLHIWGTL